MTTLIPAWVDGRLTPVEKLEVHKRGLRHKAVSVFVTSGDRILLQRRALTKYHTPGLWANTCCTHPDWDEAALDCANRRLREELGISGLDLGFRDQIEYRADVGAGLIEHEIVDVFVAESSEKLAYELNPNEVIEVRWIALSDLQQEIIAHSQIFTPWIQIYLKQHSQQIFGEGALA